MAADIDTIDVSSTMNTRVISLNLRQHWGATRHVDSMGAGWEPRDENGLALTSDAQPATAVTKG